MRLEALLDNQVLKGCMLGPDDFEFVSGLVFLCPDIHANSHHVSYIVALHFTV